MRVRQMWSSVYYIIIYIIFGVTGVDNITWSGRVVWWRLYATCPPCPSRQPSQRQPLRQYILYIRTYAARTYTIYLWVLSVYIYIYIYNVIYFIKLSVKSVRRVLYTLYYTEMAEAAAAASVRPVLMTGNGQSQITVHIIYMLYIYTIFICWQWMTAATKTRPCI